MVTSTTAVPAPAVRSRRVAKRASMSAFISAARSSLPKIAPRVVILALTPSTRSALSTDRSMAGAIRDTSCSFVRERPARITRSGFAAWMAS